MTTREINALLALRNKTHVKIARAIGERRDVVSQTVNYLRENPRIRQKIADHLGMPVEELFEPWPAPVPARQSAPAART